jgi:transposase
MEYVGIDLHKSESQVCVLDEAGEEVTAVRIPTRREAFGKLLGKGVGRRILVESSTESEWVARHLESLGHEVIVADPNYTLMYATRSRRVKTDKRDARALAEACRLNVYRPAHRVTDQQRHVRTLLDTRDFLVGTRCRAISLSRAMLRREGLRVSTGCPESYCHRVWQLELPERLRDELRPLLSTIKNVAEQIKEVEKNLSRATRGDPDAELAQTLYGVGLVVSAAVVAALDGATRFRRAHQVESYFGLVPSEASSGEKQHRGRITKVGNPRVRSLLVQSAWCILRSKAPSVAHLREWGQRLALRRGKRVAAVALARRLAGILFAMLRDQKPYEAPRLTKAA